MCTFCEQHCVEGESYRLSPGICECKEKPTVSAFLFWPKPGVIGTMETFSHKFNCRYSYHPVHQKG